MLLRMYQGAFQPVFQLVLQLVLQFVLQFVFQLLRPSPSLTRCHSLHRLGVSLAGVFQLVLARLLLRLFLHLPVHQLLRQPVLVHQLQLQHQLQPVLLFLFQPVPQLPSQLHRPTSPLLPGAPLAGVFLLLLPFPLPFLLQL